MFETLLLLVGVLVYTPRFLFAVLPRSNRFLVSRQKGVPTGVPGKKNKKQRLPAALSFQNKMGR
jgi:hypothetical protein